LYRLGGSLLGFVNLNVHERPPFYNFLTNSGLFIKAEDICKLGSLTGAVSS